MGIGKDNFAKLLELKHRYEDQDASIHERMEAVRDQARVLLGVQLKLEEHGGDRKSENQGDQVTLDSQRGTSRDYVISRLNRDAALEVSRSHSLVQN